MIDPVRIGWVSFHQESLPALEAIIAAGHKVDFLVTLTPEAKAKRSGAVDFADICAEHDIAVQAVRHIDDPDSARFIASRQPDLLVVLGWSQIIGDVVLGIPRIGTVGAHASLLPHNRGSAPVNWAIINGETESGNTLMWLNAGVDTGDIVDQRAFSISDEDTCATLYDKVAESNAEMMLDLVAALERGEMPRRPQPVSDESVLPRRKPSDGLIDWALSDQRIYDFVRALTRPYPGAFTWIAGERYNIWRAAKPLATLGETEVHEPGTALGVVKLSGSDGYGLEVACGGGSIVLLEIARAGTGRPLDETELQKYCPLGAVFDDGSANV